MTTTTTASSSLAGRPSLTDRELRSMSGYLGLAIAAGVFALAAFVGLTAFGTDVYGRASISGYRLLSSGVLACVGVFLLTGLYVLQPNYSAVVLLFGSYVGTDHATGLRWVNPFYSVRQVSRRVRSLESAKIKVNDLNGNPIEVANATIWRVNDVAKAVLQVDDYENFVKIQSETALRKLVSSHPYDDHSDQDDKVGKEPVISLLGGGEDIVNALVAELTARLAPAGIEVVEARITHLAYAPEIAPAMLRRQQAQAIVAARKSIVTGAVGMVKSALDELGTKGIVVEEDRKAALISNLLVVLVSDKDTSPIVNAGNVY